jgi:hypothetical protein
MPLGDVPGKRFTGITSAALSATANASTDTARSSIISPAESAYWLHLSALLKLELLHHQRQSSDATSA